MQADVISVKLFHLFMHCSLILWHFSCLMAFFTFSMGLTLPPPPVVFSVSTIYGFALSFSFACSFQICHSFFSPLSRFCRLLIDSPCVALSCFLVFFSDNAFVCHDLPWMRWFLSLSRSCLLMEIVVLFFAADGVGCPQSPTGSAWISLGIWSSGWIWSRPWQFQVPECGIF